MTDDGEELKVDESASTEDQGTAVAPEPAQSDGPEVTDAAPDSPGTDEAHPEFIVVEVMHVTFDLPSPSPVIHLRETVSPYRSIEFPIGLAEAQSIAMAIGKETAQRPTAHELFATVLAATGTDVIAVRLIAESGGTLIAELDLMTPRGREVVDCRPSDGIAIALRQAVPAPILSDATLLE